MLCWMPVVWCSLILPSSGLFSSDSLYNYFQILWISDLTLLYYCYCLPSLYLFVCRHYCSVLDSSSNRWWCDWRSLLSSLWMTSICAIWLCLYYYLLLLLSLLPILTWWIFLAMLCWMPVVWCSLILPSSGLFSSDSLYNYFQILWISDLTLLYYCYCLPSLYLKHICCYEFIGA